MAVAFGKPAPVIPKPPAKPLPMFKAPTVVVGPAPAIAPVPSGLAPVSVASDPNLPPPGASGLDMVRGVQPIPQTGTLTNSTNRNPAPAPGRGNIPSEVKPGARAFTPIKGISEPARTPTTADPPARYNESPDARHARLFTPLPDLGGAARPWQGRNFTINGREGGVPKTPAPVLHGSELPDPTTIPSQGTSKRGIRQQVNIARRNAKREVILRRGLGGLDYAQGVRNVPDTPSGNRETIRDVRRKTLYGAMSGHRTVPDSIVKADAIKRQTIANSGPKPVAADPENTGTPVALDSAPISIAGKDFENTRGATVATPPAPSGMQTTTVSQDSPAQTGGPIPAATSGKGLADVGILLVAGVAFMVLFKS